MIRCLIVEDEPVARDILRQYIVDTPNLNLEGECNNALTALDFLNLQTVDLIFLDINMPKLSGIDFIKSLRNPPKIILTTAYSEYALESYELDVLDYLLKPFSFERFLKAVSKFPVSANTPVIDDLIVKADGKTYRVSVSDILYAESLGDYITLVTTNNKLTFNQSLKSFLNQLPESEFIRVHKSFIVSLKNIDYVEGNLISISETMIPIGKAYKEDFNKIFK